MDYIPYHEPEDLAKVEQLAESMAKNGWQGAPIVVDGEHAITGAHRLAACQLAGIEPEVIELEDVFEEAGVDMTQAHAEEGYPTIDEPGFVYFLEALPENIRAKYGIDIQ